MAGMLELEENEMKCPYCGIKFSLDGVSVDHSFPRFARLDLYSGGTGKDPGDKEFSSTSHKCPEYRQQIMWLNEILDNAGPETLGSAKEIVGTTLLYPKFAVRQLPVAVPAPFARGFQEAYGTLDLSPKASAALSRRLLQTIIREQEKISKPSLAAEIDELLKKNKLPQYLARDLDAIRQVGNFAAHPIKDTNTGEIVDVEPGEAEWTLEVTEELLRFYFEREPKSAVRRDALNEKLRAAGKSPLLQP